MAGDNGARGENRTVPGLVSYFASAAPSVATVAPLIGWKEQWFAAARKPAMSFPFRRNAGMP